MAKKKTKKAARKKSKVRVVVIGAGSMCQRVHLPSLERHKAAKVVAICDVVEAPAREAAETFSIPKVYSDYRQMLDNETFDGVYAIGQPHFMCDIWMDCLARGLNLYIEKPMGLNMPTRPR